MHSLLENLCISILLMQCFDGGRPELSSNDVRIELDIIQIGEDPILILSGTV